MKIYKTGDRSRGVCDKCNAVVQTTFEVRDVPLEKGKGSVEDILCAVCTKCDSIVSIPQQSAPRIRESLNSKRFSIEVRLPRHLLDILLVASDQFDIGNPLLLKHSLVRYYIGIAERDRSMIKEIKRLSQSEFAKGSGNRLSLKLNSALFERFEHLRQLASLNKTQLMKGLILLINENLLQRPDKKRLKEVEKVLLASA